MEAPKKWRRKLEVRGVVKEQVTFLDQFASKLNHQTTEITSGDQLRGEVCSRHMLPIRNVCFRGRSRRLSGRAADIAESTFMIPKADVAPLLILSASLHMA